MSALEAVVSNQKDTIEGLEAELAKALGVESIHAEQFLSQQSSKNVVESKKAHDEKTRLTHEVSQLKQLLDRYNGSLTLLRQSLSTLWPLKTKRSHPAITLEGRKILKL